MEVTNILSNDIFKQLCVYDVYKKRVFGCMWRNFFSIVVLLKKLVDQPFLKKTKLNFKDLRKIMNSAQNVKL